MQVQDLVVGSGPEAVAGSRVTVHYTGWLYEKAKPDAKGSEFDSSRKGGNPFSFELGAGDVIAGWDQGVAGMRVGGQRRLTIPASLGYGERGAGGVIPPGATLLFDVELLCCNTRRLKRAHARSHCSAGVPVLRLPWPGRRATGRCARSLQGRINGVPAWNRRSGSHVRCHDAG